MKSLWKGALRFLVAAGTLVPSGICVAQTCGALSSIAIAKTADLDFGSLIATGSAGTAVINPTSGARTVTGGVFQVGGAFGPAGFNVLLCGAAGPKRFDILLPSAPIALTGSSGGIMTADTFTTNSGPNNVSGSTTPPPTPFSVGATLHVGANQRGGTYSGTFTVTVIRQ